MKIANLMFGSKRGGVEQAIVNYCLALRHAGHEATAFVRHGAAILPNLEAAGIATVTLKAPHRWNLLARYKLQTMLSSYDRVVLHGNRAGDLTHGLRNLPPTIAVAHSRFFKMHPHVRAVIALTAKRAETLATQHHCVTYVVPNLVEIPAMPTPPAQPSPPVVGFMGRLSHEKGLDLLIDALALLRARGITLRARIGGDGPEYERLHTQAQARGLAESIDWCGWVSDKADFFSRVTLFCLPSRTDGFPITLLEAMAHALPVIATDCGGPSAMLTPETGILTAISAEALADGITRALADPAAASAMGRAARINVAQHYALPVIARQLDVVMLACSEVPGAYIHSV